MADCEAPSNGVPMYKGERHYTGADGTTLRYSVHGSGPALVCCNGLGLNPCLWEPFVEFFQNRFTVLLWDYPGHGKSDTPKDPEKLTVDTLVSDLNGILNAEDIGEATLLGHSLGVQVMLRFAVVYPKKVKALVPICGSPGIGSATILPEHLLQSLITPVASFIDRNADSIQPLWRSLASTRFALQATRYLFANPALTSTEAMQPYFHNLSTVDLRVFFQLLRDAVYASTDEAAFKELDVPTLAIYGENDPITPHFEGRLLVKDLPDAELFTVRRGSHLALLDGMETILLRIEKFFRERVYPYDVVEGTYLEQSV